MFLFGTELFFAFWMASNRVGLPSMSTPPMRAATSMFLISFAKSLPRLASITAFLCFVVAHLEWPDICLSPSRNPSKQRTPEILQGLGRTVRAHHVDEQGVHAVVAGQFRVERRGERVALTHGDDVALVLGEYLGLGTHGLDPGGADENALYRIALDTLHVDRRFEGLVLTSEGVAAHDHVDATDRLLARARVEDLVGQHDQARAGAVDRQSGTHTRA